MFNTPSCMVSGMPTDRPRWIRDEDFEGGRPGTCGKTSVEMAIQSGSSVDEDDFKQV